MYRNAFARHIGGFDTMFAPFISGIGSKKAHPGKLCDLLRGPGNLPPTIPQVIGSNASEIILTGNVLHDMGYEELNWNLGCPFPRIANKKRGCGLLPYPELIGEILEEVSGKLTPRLSVKTRLGYHHPGEILEVLRVFNRFPLPYLILHPRTGLQRYRGKADPAAFERCLHLSDNPLVYNGDISSRKDYQKLKTLFPGQTRWMIGRGALINPFLPNEIKGVLLDNEEKDRRLRNFHQEIWEGVSAMIRNEARQLGYMKAVWHYLSGCKQSPRQAFGQIKISKNTREYLGAAELALQQPFSDDLAIEDYFRGLTA